MTFEALEISPWLIEALKNVGIKTPTSIQETAIPLVMAGKDVIGQAPTGTGKTYAFLLPTLSKIDMSSDRIQLLILTPTRELAQQIFENVNQVIKDTTLKAAAIYGGVETQKQVKKIDSGATILVATPGRLIDLMRQGILDVTEIPFLVIDEADQMLLLGFKDELDFLLKTLKLRKQTLCFSATMDKAVKKLAYKHLTDPVEIKSKDEEVHLSLDQKLIQTTDRWKTVALIEQLRTTNPYMGVIFCRTIRRVEKVAGELIREGFDVKPIHGDLSQNVRLRTMKAFKEGEFQYLITTDLAARGLDISHVTHIYNLDLPETVETYIHRLGRTGRMGAEGCVISIVTDKDSEQIKALEAHLGYSLELVKFERQEDHVDRTHEK